MGLDYENLKKQVDYQPVTSIKCSRIWNPDFYLKKEPRFEEARNTIEKVLQNSGLNVEEVTLSVYGSTIIFTKNMKLDSAQMKAFINQMLTKINPTLKTEKFRSMTGKVTFEITGYDYLKERITTNEDKNYR